MSKYPTRPWSLEDWEVICSGMVLEDYAARNDGYAVGMFTRSQAEHGVHGNPDLLHFGRVYCEGLLRKGGTRIESQDASELEREFLSIMSQWASQIKMEQQNGTVTTPAEVARRLGLRDIDFIEWVMTRRGTSETYWNVKCLASEFVATLFVIRAFYR